MVPRSTSIEDNCGSLGQIYQKIQLGPKEARGTDQCSTIDSVSQVLAKSDGQRMVTAQSPTLGTPSDVEKESPKANHNSLYSASRDG